MDMEDWFVGSPVTKVFVSSIVAVTFACQFKLVTPFQLYYNFDLVFRKHQYWRLITTFLFNGTFNSSTRYCQMLENGSFRGRRADFVYLFMFGMLANLLVAPLFGENFLGSSFTFMFVYIWSRRNPFIHMNFLGLLNFTAPFLPYVMLGFSFLLSNRYPIADLIGMGVGHVYYFLEDVYPQSSGVRLLRTPYILKRIIEGPENVELSTDLNMENVPIVTANEESGEEFHSPVENVSETE